MAELLPSIRLFQKLLAAQRAEAVVLGAPVVIRLPPLGVDHTVEFQPMQRGIEGAFLHAQDFIGDLLDWIARCRSHASARGSGFSGSACRECPGPIHRWSGFPFP